MRRSDEEAAKQIKSAEAEVLPRMKNRIIKLIIAIVVTAFLLAAGIYFLIIKPGNNTFPSAITDQTNFQLYYPTQLPDGYQINEDSIDYNNGVLIYSIVNPAKKQTIAVTEQQKPPGYDFSTLKGDVSFDAAGGKAIIQNATAQVTGSVVADGQTWVIMNAPAGTDVRVMRQLLSGLR